MCNPDSESTASTRCADTVKSMYYHSSEASELTANTRPSLVEADPALLLERKMEMIGVVLQPAKDGTAQVSLING